MFRELYDCSVTECCCYCIFPFLYPVKVCYVAGKRLVVGGSEAFPMEKSVLKGL